MLPVRQFQPFDTLAWIVNHWRDSNFIWEGALDMNQARAMLNRTDMRIDALESIDETALDCHAFPTPGKLAVSPTKQMINPLSSRRRLGRFFRTLRLD